MAVYPGDAYTLSFNTKVGTTDTDPTTATLTVRDPLGAIKSYTWPSGSPAITKNSTGNFSVTLTGLVQGTYRYRVVTTGAVIAANEGTFDVTPYSF